MKNYAVAISCRVKHPAKTFFGSEGMEYFADVMIVPADKDIVAQSLAVSKVFENMDQRFPDSFRELLAVKSIEL